LSFDSGKREKKSKGKNAKDDSTHTFSLSTFGKILN
jgi:hypothetical protein